jgi:hypothetical protein
MPNIPIWVLAALAAVKVAYAAPQGVSHTARVRYRWIVREELPGQLIELFRTAAYLGRHLVVNVVQMEKCLRHSSCTAGDASSPDRASVFV